jgi:hypothetical protein
LRESLGKDEEENRFKARNLGLIRTYIGRGRSEYMPIYLCLVFGADQQALAAETFEVPDGLAASLRTTRFSRAFPWSVRRQLWRGGEIVLDLVTSLTGKRRQEEPERIATPAITALSARAPEMTPFSQPQTL